MLDFLAWSSSTIDFVQRRAKTERAKKRPRGRPQKLTEEIVIRIAKRIAKGVPIESACLLDGIEHDTWLSATARNKAFSRIVKLEKAKFLDKYIEVILTGNWQAIAWILERRHKAEFGRTEPGAVTLQQANTFLVTRDIESQLNEIARKLYSHPTGERLSVGQGDTDDDGAAA